VPNSKSSCKTCPTLRAGGRAGAFAPPKGIQRLQAFSTFGFSLPIPPPAADACRWAAMTAEGEGKEG